MQPHHIIIGSGINALVAGAMLSLKGKRVLLLEREPTPGGCLKSAELTLPGFQHDVMAATWVLFMTSPAGAVLGPHLARHGFEYCHTPHPTAVIRPDGTALVLTTNRAQNIAAFNAQATGDGDQHARDVGSIEADAPFLFGLLGGALWSWPTAKLLFGQLRKRGLRGLAAWFGTSLTPARGWLETGYTSPLVQALYAPWVLHCGLTPDSTYSGQMAKVVAFALEAAGAPVVKGGAAQAVAAFRALIAENGGEIRCNSDVDRIQVKDGHVTGVALADGTQIACASVLASTAPGQLQGRLLRDVNLPGDQAGAKAFRHGRGNFQLHYALDRHPEWRSAGLDDVALIHLADGIDSVSKSANEAERGMLPEVPTICVGQPHRLDPSRCPEGKAILWLQIPDAPRVVKGDAAGKLATTGAWTDDLREAFADRIEEILARHIKDFDKIKLARCAHSPADLQSMNINLVGGDPYGGLCTIDQFFIFRPYAHSTNGTGLVRGLTHIGASTPSWPRAWGRVGLFGGKGAGRMKDQPDPKPKLPRFGEIGLGNYAPYLMNRIMGRYNASLRDDIADLGLTTPKMRALAVLSLVDAPLIGELAVLTVIEQSTLSRALDQLQTDGLIRRATDANDSRAVRIFITEQGREAFDRIWPKMAEAHEHMFRDIDQDERRAFVATLQKMLANIRIHNL